MQESILKKIKPGYIILLVIGLFIAYKYFFDNSKEINFYTQEVDKTLTDLKHQDYFALQNKLSNNLKKSVSIDDIKHYTDSINLGRKYKFVLSDYNKKDNKVVVSGTLIYKNSEKPLQITYKENNGTLLIESQKIGASLLKPKSVKFPINPKSF